MRWCLRPRCFSSFGFPCCLFFVCFCSFAPADALGHEEGVLAADFHVIATALPLGCSGGRLLVGVRGCKAGFVELHEGVHGLRVLCTFGEGGSKRLVQTAAAIDSGDGAF